MYRFKTAEQGAATSVLVATSPQLEGIGGRYALDPTNAERLWELSKTTLS